MDMHDIIELGREAALSGLVIAAPILMAALIVGIVAGIIQSMTQVQDQALSFVPKLVIGGIVFIFALPWLSEKLTDYGTDMFEKPVFMLPASNQSSFEQRVRDGFQDVGAVQANPTEPAVSVSDATTLDQAVSANRIPVRR